MIFLVENFETFRILGTERKLSIWKHISHEMIRTIFQLNIKN